MRCVWAPQALEETLQVERQAALSEARAHAAAAGVAATATSGQVVGGEGDLQTTMKSARMKVRQI